MNTERFSVVIAAPRTTVWKTLWTDETYRAWTSAFSPGSHAVTDWQLGSRVHFLDGSGSGMVSEIAAVTPNEHMAIRHLGLVSDGKEILDGPEVEGWAGAQERYTLRDVAEGTEVVVDMDIDDQHKEMFAGIWPKALQLLKDIAEKR